MTVNKQSAVNAIDVSLFPSFKTEMTSMLGDLEHVYMNRPASVQAKEFVDILVQYDCLPENFK
jgi:hypothetical protein